MTNAPPQICDRAALERNRARMRDDAAFLHREAMNDVKDRLSLVKKSFQSAAIVTGHKRIWADLFPDAKLIEDAEHLDFGTAQHDVIVHAMSLHWANDPVGQLIQCRRALAPDGLLLAVLLGGETLHELRGCLAQAETKIRGGLSPRILPMGDIRDLGALLQRAGFALPVADSVPLNVHYKDLPSLLRDLRHMGEANAMTDRVRHFTPRALFAETEDLYRKHFAGNDATLRATFDLIVLTGWAPSDSQPKPLRPGSATTRLAEALGTDETPLQD